MKQNRLTSEELETTKNLVRPVVRVMRRHLLKALHEEKARHWKMRGSHRLGKHFERGFFRGLNHAFQVVERYTNPSLFQAKHKKPTAKSQRPKAGVQ